MKKEKEKRKRKDKRKKKKRRGRKELILSEEDIKYKGIGMEQDQFDDNNAFRSANEERTME